MGLALFDPKALDCWKYSKITPKIELNLETHSLFQLVQNGLDLRIKWL